MHVKWTLAGPFHPSVRGQATQANRHTPVHSERRQSLLHKRKTRNVGSLLLALFPGYSCESCQRVTRTHIADAKAQSTCSCHGHPLTRHRSQPSECGPVWQVRDRCMFTARVWELGDVTEPGQAFHTMTVGSLLHSKCHVATAHAGPATDMSHTRSTVTGNMSAAELLYQGHHNAPAPQLERPTAAWLPI